MTLLDLEQGDHFVLNGEEYIFVALNEEGTQVKAIRDVPGAQVENFNPYAYVTRV